MKLSSGQDMIRIAICDDQESDVQKALAYTEAYMEQKKKDRYQIRQYSDGRELLEELKKGWNPEILILDVLMDEMDGIALARCLREQKVKSSIIYMSTNREMALYGYEVNAVRYLEKPLDRSKFVEALEVCFTKMERRNEKFMVPGDEGSVCFLQSNIYYIEACGAYVKIAEKDKETMAHIRISQVGTMVNPYCFLQCHRGFLVNMRHIRSVRANELELSNGVVIPVSKHRVREVKQKMLEYLEE